MRCESEKLLLAEDGGQAPQDKEYRWPLEPENRGSQPGNGDLSPTAARD